jgi:hypothetical protein
MSHRSARFARFALLTRLTHPLALAAALALAAPAWAASSASSAASDSASTSVGSLSTSVENSSKSSSKGKETAAGQYTVVDMAEAPSREGEAKGTLAMTRLRLQAVPGTGAEGEFFLTVPTVAVQQAGVLAGQRVAANAKPYGLEFARLDTQRAFFLAMSDEWMRELRTSVVTL